MAILFPQDIAEFKQNNTIEFPAEINGIGVKCAITAEALHDCFGASSFEPSDLLGAFNMHKGEIQAAARAKLPISAPLGRCLLVLADF